MKLAHEICKGCEYYHFAEVTFEGKRSKWYCEISAFTPSLWREGMQYSVQKECPRFLEHVVLRQEDDKSST